MSSPAAVDPSIGARTRAVLDRLAAFQRGAGTDGERAGAEIVAAELESRGARVRIEEECVHGTYWVPIGMISALGAGCGRGGRAIGAVGGALSTACIIDELEIGRRPLRRVLRQRTAANVIGEVGPEAADRTLVVHAHHDAAHTGLVFHPAIAKLAARVGGGLIERMGGTPAPMWGAMVGPAAVTLGAALGRPRARWLGAALSACYVAAMLNIAASPPVPGANDNLSAVAVLLAVSEILAEQPPCRLRVLLLSTGSEESFLETMQRFGERHFGDLPPGSTTFLCLESVGSPELMLLSGEGLLRLHRYPDEQIRVLTRLANDVDIPLHEPFRYRLATDGQVPLRSGYATAVITSIDWYKAPSNYHWPSDRPENLNLETVARAARLATALVRHLDER